MRALTYFGYEIKYTDKDYVYPGSLYPSTSTPPITKVTNF